MTDMFDAAQDLEQRERDAAIAVAAAHPNAGRPDCADCGAPIDAKRRAAMPTAQRCFVCQAAAERRGHLGRGA